MFLNFDFSHLQNLASWLVIIYTAVLLAMFIDLLTGIRKAKQLKLITTSKGLRKTAEKAMLYLLPMFCLTLIDALASVILDYPWLTSGMGIFNIYIEIRSVWENTHTQLLAKLKKQCADDLIKFLSEHKEELERILIK